MLSPSGHDGAVSNDAAHPSPLDDLLASARVVALPLATRFRGIDVREAVLFEGPEGWTEFSPFVEYDDDEASTWLAAAIDFGWMAQPAPVRSEIPRQRHRAGGGRGIRPRRAGALRRMPHREGQGRRARPAARRRHRPRARRARGAGRRGPRSASTRTARWNVDEAEHALHALAEFDLEYVEQPCATVDELAELRRRVKYMGIPIAADESVRKAADPLAVARAGAADLLVIKAQPLGGVRRALEIVAEAGLPAVVSSALDTSVGLVDGRRPRRRAARARLRLRARARRRCSRRTSPHPPLAPRGGVLHGRPGDARPGTRSTSSRHPPTGGSGGGRASARCHALLARRGTV